MRRWEYSCCCLREIGKGSWSSWEASSCCPQRQSLQCGNHQLCQAQYHLWAWALFRWAGSGIKGVKRQLNQKIAHRSNLGRFNRKPICESTVPPKDQYCWWEKWTVSINPTSSRVTFWWNPWRGIFVERQIHVALRWHKAKTVHWTYRITYEGFWKPQQGPWQVGLDKYRPYWACR